MGYKHLIFEENTLFLVTGGAGFIGSNLCEAILNMGNKTVTINLNKAVQICTAE